MHIRIIEFMYCEAIHNRARRFYLGVGKYTQLLWEKWVGFRLLYVSGRVLAYIDLINASLHGLIIMQLEETDIGFTM